VKVCAVFILGPRLEGAGGKALVEALRYKPEGRGFDSRFVFGIFHLHISSGRTMALVSIQPLTEMSTGIFSGDEGGRCVRLTTLSSSCADCLKIWKHLLPATIRTSQGL
jgi:hypothetical protein